MCSSDLVVVVPDRPDVAVRADRTVDLPDHRDDAWTGAQGIAARRTTRLVADRRDPVPANRGAASHPWLLTVSGRQIPIH